MSAEDWDPAGPRRSAPSDDRPARLDVGERREDVRRIARSQGAWRLCLAVGWDAEDLEQELLLRAHARQSQPSRYDPTRACVSKYLTVLLRSLLLHLYDEGRVRRDRRLKELASPLPWSDDPQVADAVTRALADDARHRSQRGQREEEGREPSPPMFNLLMAQAGTAQHRTRRGQGEGGGWGEPTPPGGTSSRVVRARRARNPEKNGPG